MVTHTIVPTLLDKLIYDAANTIPGTWAVDVDEDTDEPLRVRSDFAPYQYGWSVASVIKGDTLDGDSYVGSGRLRHRAIRALKLAREVYFKHQKDREMWRTGS